MFTLPEFFSDDLDSSLDSTKKFPVPETEPTDNGTREKCFWCKRKTVFINTGFPNSKSRWCPQCRK